MADETMSNPDMDEQKQYLVSKIDELLEGVGPGYGESLMAELIVRLERTVAHFHEEVTDMLESLRTKSMEQEEKLKELWNENGTPVEIPEVEEETDSTDAELEMSEWERRLEEKTAKKEAYNKSPSRIQKEEEKVKKRGFFGRKKK